VGGTATAMTTSGVGQVGCSVCTLLGTFGEIVLREGHELPTLLGDEIDYRSGAGRMRTRGGCDEGRSRFKGDDRNCKLDDEACHDFLLLR